jgi:hypothetical protein
MDETRGDCDRVCLSSSSVPEADVYLIEKTASAVPGNFVTGIGTYAFGNLPPRVAS